MTPPRLLGGYKKDDASPNVFFGLIRVYCLTCAFYSFKSNSRCQAVAHRSRAFLLACSCVLLVVLVLRLLALPQVLFSNAVPATSTYPLRFSASKFDLDFDRRPDSPPMPFMPSSRRLQFDGSHDGSAFDPLRPSLVPLLRAFHLVSSMLYVFTSTVCFLAAAMAMVALSQISFPAKPLQLSLQAKALLCVSMLFFQRVHELHHQAWHIQASEETIPEEDFTSEIIDQPFATFDCSSLLEGPCEVMVVMGPGHGLSHIKVGADHGLQAAGDSVHAESAPSAAPPVHRESRCRRTLDFLNLMPEPNAGEGDCFWLSLQNYTRPAQQARATVAQWLRANPNHPAFGEADDLEGGALTSE